MVVVFVLDTGVKAGGGEKQRVNGTEGVHEETIIKASDGKGGTGRVRKGHRHDHGLQKTELKNSGKRDFLSLSDEIC